MKKYLMLLGVAFCLTAAANVMDKGKWTGFIGDDHCGTKGNNKEHAACAVKLVENFIGDEVTITGTITNNVLEIETIKNKK
jgi:hypothetical protein